ncbi:hypothetical protein BGZ73_005702 [Actinomortierella ambigua]|nr:hypothetical protein BGZ73_005702 [Actinomortierella ambigua]
MPVKNPYENASFPLQHEPHTLYTPSPAGTWFNLEKVLTDHPLKTTSGSISRQQNIRSFQRYNSIQQNVYISYPDSLKDVVGQFPNVTLNFTIPKNASWPPTDASIVYMAPNNTQSSLLGNIPVRYMNARQSARRSYESSDVAGYRTSQFFHKPYGTESMDDTIQTMVNRIANNSNFFRSEFEEFQGGLPFGALIIDSADMDRLRLKMTMQMGMTVRERFSQATEESAGLRQMITMSQMTTSMMKHKFGSNYTITQGVRIMPFVWNARSLFNEGMSAVGSDIYPFALVFLLPTFVGMLVQEKEDRHCMMMAMNGLRKPVYYAVHYIEYMCMQLILSLFFAFAATAAQAELVGRTSPAFLVVLFLVWSHTMVSFSFFLSSFFSRANKVSLTVYFFVAISCIIGALPKHIFKDGVPILWSLHPIFAFFRLMQIAILRATMMNDMHPVSLSDITPGNPVFDNMMILLGESVIFLILTGYLSAVVPSEYGVTHPWHFPISMWFKSSSNTAYDPEAIAAAGQAKYHQGSHDPQRILIGADADVYTERDRVESSQYTPDKTPLILHNLFHQYPNKVEPALRGVSFGVPRNQVLGLLGPNGAGKSTMIHLLTGLYTPTSGTAFVAGSDIRKDMATVHSRIGVCPQHDILWNDLTIADHLLFYSRLRGISPAQEQQAVDYALANVSLTALRDRQVGGLSGGEKRRVSIAISLLGDNKVIFLDEPSTGLDPEVRRVIWDVVHRIKKGRTVILTTHSMEEADMLSDRICIMTMGRLRCIGSSLHLKEKYGSGFRLNISSKPGRLEEACQSIEEQLMVGKDYRRIDKFTNASTFEFQLSATSLSYTSDNGQEHGELSMIFHKLNQPTMFPAIEDWSISQATLEDVFIKVVTQGEDAIALPGIAQYTA